jgi:DNA-binding beta-propeller fold protein YncE
MHKLKLWTLVLAAILALAAPLVSSAQHRAYLPIIVRQHRFVPPGQTGVFPLTGRPYSLSINPSSGRLYVARSQAKDVAVLDLYSLSQIASTPLSKGPQAVRVNESLGRSYASYGNPLYVISHASNNLLGEIPDGVYGPSELAVNPSNARVYCADWSVFVGEADRVHIYDGNTNGRINTVDLGLSPDVENISVAVNKSTGLAYAAYSGDGQIAVIGTNAQIQTRIAPSTMATSPSEPWMAINPFSNRLYLRGQSTTAVIDLNTNTEVGTLDEDGLIAVDVIRNRVYVQSLSKIHVYNGFTNAKIREIALDKYRYVTDIAVDSPTQRILLAAPNNDELVVVKDG